MLRGMGQHWIPVATVALAGTLLGGCAEEDAPAVCNSLEAVHASVDDVRHAGAGENGLTQLRTDLSQLRLHLDQLQADARAQFQPQLDTVRAAAGQVSSSVAAARTEPTATTLDGVRTAVTGLSAAVQNLDTAMSQTC